MSLKKKIDLKALILSLLKEGVEINIREIAEKGGLLFETPSDRRAIQRALAGLIKEGALEVAGKARARVYSLKDSLFKSPEPSLFLGDEADKDRLKNIFISEGADELLHYFSEPLHHRKPIGYNQDFLRSYIPNQTSYLSPSLQKELLKVSGIQNNIQPAGTYARNILNRLFIDLSWNSSRLEGNTYSLLETKRLIELGKNAAGKDLIEAQMILNHKDAIEYIVESAHEKKISAHEVCSIHALLSNNLLGDPSASGRVREIAVGISGTTYLPLDNPHVLKEYCDMFIKKMNLIDDPFEQSFFALVHLSYMQAFEDVNKRTARIVANIPLIKRNLKPLSFTDVDQETYGKSLLGVYEKNDVCLFRDLYLWAYTRSSQRYSAIQQAMGEPNLLKLKYRADIQGIIRTVILEKVAGPHVVQRIQNLMAVKNFPE